MTSSTRGVVRQWSADEGWGVIDSDETPGGCWLHVSTWRGRHFGRVPVGGAVEFTYEPAPQTPYAFRAREAWPAGEEPFRDNVVEVQGPSEAYRSEVRITFDEG